MADPKIAERARTEGQVRPLPQSATLASFAASRTGDRVRRVLHRFGNARVVLLGEATHGTADFYNARAAITRRLIEQHGFSIVAVEADWPNASRVDRYVRHRGRGTYDEECFARFPTWMWRGDRRNRGICATATCSTRSSM
jgi:erythromycin esterase-like protein